jgi:protocatechuate 3,4-dioxygenase alpha subunit
VIATASQTIGPFWHGLADPALADLLRHGAAGDRIELVGRVTDGDGAAVADACIELWQPGVGWGRCATGADGGFAFTTIAAPVIAVMVLARGLLKPLWTRVYFADPGDEFPADRRHTLVARREGAAWRWNIRLQGPDETVFLAW